MLSFLEKRQLRVPFRLMASFVILAFFSSLMMVPPNAHSQSALHLPAPGVMLTPTPGFMPAVMKGIKIFPQSPLRFDFIIDTGNAQLDDEALETESTKLIKYFLASLTVPENELWVNLSPYEKDRIIPDQFGVTEMGRDLLAQDYVLKQFTASLIYPEEKLGGEFWERVYAKARERYGTSEIPVNTFNKVWVVPEKATIYESGDMAFIVESRLKVMLEGDYFALKDNMNDEDIAAGQLGGDETQELSDVSSQMIREIILPEIEKEVNHGKNFVALRQIYHSVILATWFKRNLRESLLGKVYVEKNKVSGVDIEDKQVREKIYQQYLAAFKTGVYDYIKEDYDPVTQERVPRKYFSGGTVLGGEMLGAVLSVERETKAETLETVEQTTNGPLTAVSTRLNLIPGPDGNSGPPNDGGLVGTQTQEMAKNGSHAVSAMLGLRRLSLVLIGVLSTFPAINIQAQDIIEQLEVAPQQTDGVSIQDFEQILTTQRIPFKYYPGKEWGEFLKQNNHPRGSTIGITIPNQRFDGEYRPSIGFVSGVNVETVGHEALHAFHLIRHSPADVVLDLYAFRKAIVQDEDKDALKILDQIVQLLQGYNSEARLIDEVLSGEMTRQKAQDTLTTMMKNKNLEFRLFRDGYEMQAVKDLMAAHAFQLVVGKSAEDLRDSDYYFTRHQEGHVGRLLKNSFSSFVIGQKPLDFKKMSKDELQQQRKFYTDGPYSVATEFFAWIYGRSINDGSPTTYPAVKRSRNIRKLYELTKKFSGMLPSLPNARNRFEEHLGKYGVPAPVSRATLSQEKAKSDEAMWANVKRGLFVGFLSTLLNISPVQDSTAGQFGDVVYDTGHQAWQVRTEEGDTLESIARQAVGIYYALSPNELPGGVIYWKNLVKEKYVGSYGEVQPKLRALSSPEDLADAVVNKAVRQEMFEFFRKKLEGVPDWETMDVGGLSNVLKNGNDIHVDMNGQLSENQVLDLTSARDYLHQLKILRTSHVVHRQDVNLKGRPMEVVFIDQEESPFRSDSSVAITVNDKVFMNLNAFARSGKNLFEHIEGPRSEYANLEWDTHFGDDRLLTDLFKGKTPLELALARLQRLWFHEVAGHGLTQPLIHGGQNSLFERPITSEQLLTTSEVSGGLAEIAGSVSPRLTFAEWSRISYVRSFPVSKHVRAAAIIQKRMWDKLDFLDFAKRKVYEDIRRKGVEEKLYLHGVKELASVAGEEAERRVIEGLIESGSRLDKIDRYEWYQMLTDEQVAKAARDIHNEIFGVELPGKDLIHIPEAVKNYMKDKYFPNDPIDERKDDIRKDDQSRSEEHVGGIDLDPEMLDLQTQGAGMDFDAPFDPQAIESMPIEGVSPVILQIGPANLPMFIGVSDL